MKNSKRKLEHRLLHKIQMNFYFATGKGSTGVKLEKVGPVFSSCNPFPSWPTLKAKDTDNYNRGLAVRKVILNRTEALLQGFLSFQCVFSLPAEISFPRYSAGGRKRALWSQGSVCLGFKNNSKIS